MVLAASDNRAGGTMKRISILLLAFTAGIAGCDADRTGDEVPRTGESALEGAEVDEATEQAGEAMDLVNASLGTLEQMQQDPALWALTQSAQGIFVVPQYAQAAVGVGAGGGEGVLLARVGDRWSDPAFYDVGGVSVGAQLGASGGEIAVLLMTAEAVESFEQENDFSLNAGAGLVLADYAALGGATTEGSDVIVWSDTEGAFVGVTLGLTGIAFDEEEAEAYYQQPVTPTQIIEGRVTGPQSEMLQRRITG
jgi:SH3 domain-containing YSC84-like protein 1